MYSNEKAHVNLHGFYDAYYCTVCPHYFGQKNDLETILHFM